MTFTATVTTKGQITLPVGIRKALGIVQGDRLSFTRTGDRVELAKTPSFLDLAASIVPADDIAGEPWHEVRRKVRDTHATEQANRGRG
ncbi:MAG: AbrB/MazE/SpoVT family DNA-binding domain-containing protein [Cellulomonadaceae bacterium]|jgi:AbrB family looped-hinge helix DNA binding protein|nr:AbrB/MazE/SpoVT family DNA-binding domain-containing protein [Cellulomonadaceae bacterium]